MPWVPNVMQVVKGSHDQIWGYEQSMLKVIYYVKEIYKPYF